MMLKTSPSLVLGTSRLHSFAVSRGAKASMWLLDIICISLYVIVITWVRYYLSKRGDRWLTSAYCIHRMSQWFDVEERSRRRFLFTAKGLGCWFFGDPSSCKTDGAWAF